MYWDSTYLLILPAFLLALWAQARVKRVMDTYSRQSTHQGKPAHEVAAEILEKGGALGVRVEPVSGQLSDHYDPKAKVLRLSEGVYASDSVAALGVAAHEAGHAIQDAEGYSPLSLRTLAVPVVNIGTKAAMPLFILGLIVSLQPLVYVGIALYSLAVLFSLITLPVEFNASSRAMRALAEGGYLDAREEEGARKVLSAAAMTYVAAAAVAIMQLLRLMTIANRNRRSN